MPGSGDHLAPPDLKFLGVFADVSDSTVRSLRFYSRTPPEGALAWVQAKSSLYHFERYSERPDDDDSVITLANGGRFIRGVNGFRTQGRDYGTSGAIPGPPNSLAVATVNLRSVQEGDRLLALFSGALIEAGTAATDCYMWFTAAGAQVEGNIRQVVAFGSGNAIALSKRITVGASPPDPYPVTLTAMIFGGGPATVTYNPYELNVFALA